VWTPDALADASRPHASVEGQTQLAFCVRRTIELIRETLGLPLASYSGAVGVCDARADSMQKAHPRRDMTLSGAAPVCVL